MPNWKKLVETRMGPAYIMAALAIVMIVFVTWVWG